MSHKNFDKKTRSILNNMNDIDHTEALSRKEEVWNSLDINSKKSKSYRWLVWLLLGLISIIGGTFLINEYSNTEKSPEVLIAKAEVIQEFELQINDLKDQLNEMKLQYASKDEVIDSLHSVNKEMYHKIQTVASQENLGSLSEVVTINVRDTIYLKEFKKEEIVRERVIRDTVYIEIPVLNDDNELMAENNTSERMSTGSFSADKGNSKSKKRPASIQFNFSEVKRDK